MHNVIQKMYVSAAGTLLLLLPALAACEDKPNEPTPPEPEDDNFTVVIEEAYNGEVYNTRTVGRSDVVRLGDSGSEAVAWIKWPDDIGLNQTFDFIFSADQGLYCKSGGFRFTQHMDPQMTPIDKSGFGKDNPSGMVPCTTLNAGDSRTIYVRLEYEKTFPIVFMNTPDTSYGTSWHYDVSVTYTLNGRYGSDRAEGTITSTGWDQWSYPTLIVPGGATNIQFVNNSSEGLVLRIDGIPGGFETIRDRGASYSGMRELLDYYGTEPQLMIVPYDHPY